MSGDSRYACHDVFCGRMISKRRFQIALFIAAALTAGCEAQNQPPTPSLAANAAPRKIDEWIGRWNGPGRNLSGNLEKWRHLRNPDQGFGQGANLPRNRDERRYFIREKRKAETIRSGNGEQTGMKWLLDKKNCLVTRYGEGYCRG